MPAMLSIVWSGCKREGVIAGYLTGLVTTLGVWIYTASLEEGGLEYFLDNTRTLITVAHATFSLYLLNL